MSFCEEKKAKEQTLLATSTPTSYDCTYDGVDDDFVEDCIGCGCHESHEGAINNHDFDTGWSLEPTRASYQHSGVRFQREKDINYGLDHGCEADRSDPDSRQSGDQDFTQAYIELDDIPQPTVSQIVAAQIQAKMKEFYERAERTSTEDGGIVMPDHVRCRNPGCRCEQMTVEHSVKLEQACEDDKNAGEQHCETQGPRTKTVEFTVVRVIWTQAGDDVEYERDQQPHLWINRATKYHSRIDVGVVDGEFLLSHCDEIKVEVYVRAQGQTMILKWDEGSNVFRTYNVHNGFGRLEAGDEVIIDALCCSRRALGGTGSLFPHRQ